tara:strand:+ start:1840 stop:2025 length:186 start_codon:yes stop_codon:yes gene_type:complete
MPKKNTIKQQQSMCNEGHMRPDELKFQYDIKGAVEKYKRVKPQDVFDNYKDNKIKKKVKKK